jgi:hypothetical protein
MDVLWLFTLTILHAVGLLLSFPAWHLAGLGYPRYISLDLHRGNDWAMKPGRVIELKRAA